MSEPRDDRERLLAFVERVELLHYEDGGGCACSGSGTHLSACGGSCGPLDPVGYCHYCDCDWPCDEGRAAAAIRAVLKIHYGLGIYDDCGHAHADGEANTFDAEGVGVVCEAGRVDTVCVCCDTSDGEMDVLEYVHDREPGTSWPCPTLRAMADALDKE